MLGWLHSFCWRNRSFAFLNDATDGIAPPPDQLFNIAGRLQLPLATIQLKDSGYRKMDNGQFEVLVDAGNIIPAYQPGHAHSDMLSVCFMYNGKPVLTDTGISTYEPVSRRYEERRTAAHNTVVIDGLDQSEVWNSFRVGRRAHCSILKDDPVHVCAEHNGYKRSAGILHRRSVELNAKRLTIMDELIRLVGSNRKFEATALFHFNHGIEPVPISAWEYKISDSLILKLQGDCRTEVASYSQASGFNKVVNAKKLIVSFEGKLVSVFESV
jgi:hypothetical protein